VLHTGGKGERRQLQVRGEEVEGLKRSDQLELFLTLLPLAFLVNPLLVASLLLAICRLTSLVMDKALIEGVERAKGIPEYAKGKPKGSELEVEFPEVKEEVWKKQIDPGNKGYDIVYKDGRMFKQVNFTKDGNVMDKAKRTEMRMPFVLPSLVSAYEFQILNMRGYDLDLSCFFPGHYFKKVEEQARTLGLSKEILDRTKVNLKHVSVAYSALNITHQPNYILAAGIYLAFRYCATKINQTGGQADR